MATLASTLPAAAAARVARALFVAPALAPARRGNRFDGDRRRRVGGIAGAIVAPYDPLATSWTAIRKAPGGAHWFGTDEIGRDVLSRVIWGARASLLAGIVSVLISLSIGVPVGLLAGYAGGKVDILISRLTDAVLACFCLAIVAAFLAQPSNAMIAIGSRGPSSSDYARTDNGHQAEDFILAARAIGNPPAHCVVPCAQCRSVDRASYLAIAAVIAEAGCRSSASDSLPHRWGSMLNAAQRFLTNAPWMAIWPGLAIFLVVLSFNLVGDGLRDALDPRDA